MCENPIIEERFMISFVPDCYETQKWCEKSVSGYPLMLKYCPSRYKT